MALDSFLGKEISENISRCLSTLNPVAIFNLVLIVKNRGRGVSMGSNHFWNQTLPVRSSPATPCHGLQSFYHVTNTRTHGAELFR
jgi:hypothetical protein